MRKVLSEDRHIAYLDPQATRLLEQGRECYRSLDLDKQRLLTWGDSVLILTWAGDRTNDTIAAWLNRRGLRAVNDGLLLTIRSTDSAAISDALFDLADSPSIDAEELLPSEDVPTMEKWEWLLPPALLRRQYASCVFDIPRAQDVARELA